MKVTTQYKIVAANFSEKTATHESLEVKVQELIAQDYEPLGAPFIGQNFLYQALIKHEEPESRSV